MKSRAIALKCLGVGTCCPLQNDVGFRFKKIPNTTDIRRDGTVPWGGPSGRRDDKTALGEHEISSLEFYSCRSIAALETHDGLISSCITSSTIPAKVKVLSLFIEFVVVSLNVIESLNHRSESPLLRAAPSIT